MARSGGMFLSGGPLVTLSVDGDEPGDTVAALRAGNGQRPGHGGQQFPARWLELVRERRGRREGRRRRWMAGRAQRLPAGPGDSWIACRAFGADHHLDDCGRRVFAHTSPVYLACGGDRTMTDPEGLRYIRTLVEGARDYVPDTAVRQVRPGHDSPSRRTRPPHLAGAALHRGPARPR